MKSMCVLLNNCGAKMADNWGAFHSTKCSSLKFRVFHATNGTYFPVPSLARKRRDSLTFVYLLSGYSIEDAEVKINDLLGEGDNTT